MCSSIEIPNLIALVSSRRRQMRDRFMRKGLKICGGMRHVQDALLFSLSSFGYEGTLRALWPASLEADGTTGAPSS